MNALRQLLIASLSLAILASGGIKAASTIDFTDQWWTATESGWGASVTQQSNILYIELMVYGSDGKPSWFAGAASQSTAPAGHTMFVGDLNVTTGPYYGNPSFNPNLVIGRRVGTVTFDATAWNSAAISYTVDGVVVTRNVTRFTLAINNLTGNYNGAWHYECSNGGLTVNDWFTLNITQNVDNSVQMLWTEAPDPFGFFTFHGTYSQSGRLGQIVADLQPTDRGTVTFFEIEKTAFGFVGRFSGSINFCDVRNGRISAVLR